MIHIVLTFTATCNCILVDEDHFRLRLLLHFLGKSTLAHESICDLSCSVTSSHTKLQLAFVSCRVQEIMNIDHSTTRAYTNRCPSLQNVAALSQSPFSSWSSTHTLPGEYAFSCADLELHCLLASTQTHFRHISSRQPYKSWPDKRCCYSAFVRNRICPGSWKIHTQNAISALDASYAEQINLSPSNGHRYVVFSQVGRPWSTSGKTPYR